MQKGILYSKQDSSYCYFIRVQICFSIKRNIGYNVDMNKYSFILDGSIILIILISAWMGRKRGIVDTALKLVGIIGAIFLALKFTKALAGFLKGTFVRDWIYVKVLEKMTQEGAGGLGSLLGLESSGNSKFLPDFIGDFASDLVMRGKEMLASGYTSIILTIISFIGILIVVWGTVTIIRLLYRRKRKTSGIISFIDGMSGMLLGLLKGFVISCLLVALTIPLTLIFSSFSLPEVMTGMNNSVIANWIQDTNPLFVLIKTLIFG